MSTGSSRRAKTPEQRNEEVKTLVGQLHDAVVGLCQDDRWTSMLQVTASLPHYSFGNRLLLLSQAEQRGMALTAVMSYRAWQKAGRQVRKGERGLRILAPRRRRLSHDEAAERGEEGYENGHPRVVVRGFTTETVFEIAQTEGLELPETSHTIAGEDPAGLWADLCALVEAQGYDVEREGLEGGADGVTIYAERRVLVRPDVEGAEATAILAHELGHIRADHEHRREISRARREAEAESIAYVIAHAHGLDTGQAAQPYVAGWSGGDTEVLREAAQVVTEVATTILAELADRHRDDGETEDADDEVMVGVPA